MRTDLTPQILAIAAPAHGVCTRADLLDAGIGDAAIDRRLASGMLVAIRRGVYEAPILADDLTPLFGAVLAVPKSVLSRGTAASLHRFSLPAPDRVHVTAPIGAGRALEGIVVHESRHLLENDVVTTADGLPVTSPARTIIDLSAELRPKRLRHLVRTQTAACKPPLDDLQRAFTRLARSGRRGMTVLRHILDELGDDASVPLESELESLVWKGIQRCGLRGISPQFRPPWFDGYRGVVDFAHPGAAVIVEADGRRWHARRAAMQEDRRRDRIAVANGWVVIRLMWEDVVVRGVETFDELASIVESRTAERVPRERG